MIELKHDALMFTFPRRHPKATLKIDFRRTLGIPDDGRDYPLPSGFGRFPLRRVKDFPQTVSRKWFAQGGVMMPMHESEALWIGISSDPCGTPETAYPFAVKVASGRVNALTGEPWSDTLQHHPQDYIVSTEQPWVDGFSIEKETGRQFVAMPLGSGCSAEAQLTGTAEHGGIQIGVCPMKPSVYEKRLSELTIKQERRFTLVSEPPPAPYATGLAPGGRLRQVIYRDPYDPEDWDANHFCSCSIHIVNSLAWRGVTGEPPPPKPLTATDYTLKGHPWYFYFNADTAPLPGSDRLQRLKSIRENWKEMGETSLPEQERITPTVIYPLRKGMNMATAREGN